MTLEKHPELAQPSLTNEKVSTDAGSKQRGLGRCERGSRSPYRPCARGVIERYYQYVRETIAREVTARDTCKSLDELNASIEAWLAARERKHDRCDSQRLPTTGGKRS